MREPQLGGAHRTTHGEEHDAALIQMRAPAIGRIYQGCGIEVTEVVTDERRDGGVRGARGSGGRCDRSHDAVLSKTRLGPAVSCAPSQRRRPTARPHGGPPSERLVAGEGSVADARGAVNARRRLRLAVALPEAGRLKQQSSDWCRVPAMKPSRQHSVWSDVPITDGVSTCVSC